MLSFYSLHYIEPQNTNLRKSTAKGRTVLAIVKYIKVAVYFQRVSILLNLCYLCLLKNCFFSFDENDDADQSFIYCRGCKKFHHIGRTENSFNHGSCCVLCLLMSAEGITLCRPEKQLKKQGHEITVSTAPIVVTILFTPSISRLKPNQYTATLMQTIQR